MQQIFYIHSSVSQKLGIPKTQFINHMKLKKREDQSVGVLVLLRRGIKKTMGGDTQMYTINTEFLGCWCLHTHTHTHHVNFSINVCCFFSPGFPRQVSPKAVQVATQKGWFTGSKLSPVSVLWAPTPHTAFWWVVGCSCTGKEEALFGENKQSKGDLRDCNHADKKLTSVLERILRGSSRKYTG